MTTSEMLLDYLAQQFGPDGPACPLCGRREWFTPPEGPHSIEGLPMSMSDEPDGWAPPVGAWLCICAGCGFIAPLLDEFVRAEKDSEESG